MMSFKKYAKTFAVISFAFLLIILSIFSATAITVGEIWDNVNIYSTDEPILTTSSIKCFDVNKNEQILITLNDTERLVIFDCNGNIEKQFKFSSDGSYSARFNDENNIELFFVRGGFIFEFTQDGEYCNYSECDYNQWEKESNFRQSYTINYNTYSLEKAPLTLMGDSYARLVKTEGKGNDTVFYDVTSPQICRNILFIGMLLVMFVVAPLFFVYIILKNVKEKRSRYPAPPGKIIPVSKKQIALKWSITALLLVKVAFTIVEFITTSMESYTYFSFVSAFVSCVVAVATVGTVGTIIFIFLAVMIVICNILGIIFLLTLKHKPIPAVVFLSIAETADILVLTGFLFDNYYIVSNILALVLNLFIVALIFIYRHITFKNRSKYLS